MRPLLTLLSVFVITSNLFAQFPSDVKSLEIEEKKTIEKNTGKSYPAFQAESLAGISYSQSNLIGKITIINFWFELCEPCLAELDALNNLWVKLNDNKKFQFISFTRDAPDIARECVKRYNLLYPVISISNEECYRLNCNLGFPTTIIVDESGKIIYIKSGGSTEKQAVKDKIDKIAQTIQTYLSK